MTTFIATLSWGFAALLTVAVAVALWEYLQTKSRRHVPLEPPQPRRVASLDVDLDRVPDTPTGDRAQRAAALDNALGRMSSPPAAPARQGGQAWTETQPMVAASLQVELPAEPPRP